MDAPAKSPDGFHASLDARAAHDLRRAEQGVGGLSTPQWAG